MCGLAAIFAYHSSAPPVDQGELLRIREAMHARGPDGEGVWIPENRRIGLAHRRLSIIDLSDAGAQPMATPDGAVRIVFNGEIYNYRELRLSLEAKGYRFRSHSDTEVLLYLYLEHGRDFLHQLRGMYAITLWDERMRGLLLARDPFGIKPLYYADDGKSIRVASQVKALLKGGAVDTSPEPAGHAGFFLWGSVPAPWTLYRGIRNLPAGHCLWVDERGVGQPTPFCLITDILAEAATAPAEGSRFEALEVIAEAVRDSVRAHLVSDVPVGVFLSAGLDSAMLAALASEGGARPHSLTLSFAEYSGTENDEAPLAEMLAARLRTRHATLMVRREDFEDEREKLLAAMDQPSIDGVNTWFVARAAASQGIKVALSGIGGDELFASYPSFSDLPRITRLFRPFASVPEIGKLFCQLTAPLAARFTSPKYAGLLEYGGSLGGAYLLRRSVYMPWELPSVLDPDTARQGLQDLQTMEELNATLVAFRVPLSADRSRLAVSALEMSWYMRHQLLRDTDWASMAQSLEIRTPFLDVPLLKTIAPWLAAHPQLTKPIVAAAIAPQIPSAFVNKPKTGFSIPVRDWIVNDQAHQVDRGLRGWTRFIYAHSKAASFL
jgi:asparagine synthase (glutamine-hydrolysing)